MTPVETAAARVDADFYTTDPTGPIVQRSLPAVIHETLRLLEVRPGRTSWRSAPAVATPALSWPNSSARPAM